MKVSLTSQVLVLLYADMLRYDTAEAGLNLTYEIVYINMT